jgi:hypothetical protein
MNSQLLAKNLEEVCNDFERIGRERRKRVVDEYFAYGQIEEDASPVAFSAASQHDLVGVTLDLQKLPRDRSTPGKSGAGGCARILCTQCLQRRVNEIVIEFAIAEEEEVEGMQHTGRIL